MSKRILVVEDQEDNRRIVRDLLTRSGYEIVEAVTGEEGVTLAETQHPDLILMDIQLPVIAGYEAPRRIKGNQALHHIPLTAVTAYFLSGDDDMAVAPGSDDYLAQPYSARAQLVKNGQYVP